MINDFSFYILDRRHGDDVVADVEEGISKMEAYIKALEVEIKERQDVIDLLDLADVFYETQKGEARIVCNVSFIVNYLVLFINFLFLSLFHFHRF